MAKGKQAAKAANRRLEATQDHVDRLTEQLADQKMRARDAEARAVEADQLRERIRVLEAQIAEGPTEATLDKLRWWESVRKADIKRRRAAQSELFRWFNRDTDDLVGTVTVVEAYEVMCGVLPHVMAAIEACDVSHIRKVAKEGARFPDDPKMEREAYRKWQQFVKKERHTDETLVPDLIDILSGVQERLTVDEIIEMVPDRFVKDGEELTQSGYLKASSARAARAS